MPSSANTTSPAIRIQPTRRNRGRRIYRFCARGSRERPVSPFFASARGRQLRGCLDVAAAARRGCLLAAPCIFVASIGSARRRPVPGTEDRMSTEAPEKEKRRTRDGPTPRHAVRTPAANDLPAFPCGPQTVHGCARQEMTAVLTNLFTLAPHRRIRIVTHSAHLDQ